MTRRTSRRSGFTLLEVMLVLAILVVMGSSVTYYFVGAQQKANTRQAISQISMLEDMLTAYHMDVGSYPSTSQGLAALRTSPPELANTNIWQGPYAAKEIPPDPWRNPYQYELAAADQYMIWSWGPDQQNGTEDDIRNTQ
jgi:general secretion pathway protein G